jgi:hypothetical protein
MFKQLINGCTLATMIFLASMCTLMAQGIDASEATQAGLAPQTSKALGVTITVTPASITNEAKTWDFEIVLESHTQALSDDLAGFSILIGDGKQTTPLSWEGSPPGGHHRKGLLRYKPISPAPQSLEMQIRRTGEPIPRSFRWRLK